MKKMVMPPESVDIIGNVHTRICDTNRRLINNTTIHNTCTDDGLMYILFCILQEYTPAIKYFGITTLITDDLGRYNVEKDHIFRLDAHDDNDRGGLIRDLISGGGNTYRARFKFYLQSNQLNGEILKSIHLYMQDANGNLFKAFSANHATYSDGQLILKDNTITVSYEWIIGLRNEFEEESV